MIENPPYGVWRVILDIERKESSVTDMMIFWILWLALIAAFLVVGGEMMFDK